MNVQIVRSFHGRPLIDTEDNGLTLRLDQPAPGPIPWWGARTLLALLQVRFRARVVDEALVPHRTLLSLVLRGLECQLTHDERKSLAFASANFAGILPEPRLRSDAIIEAWAGAFDTILTGVDATIVFGDAVRLDAESIGLIRPLLRRTGLRGRLRFVVGIDGSWEPHSRYERVRRALLNYECQTLAALDCTDQVTTSKTAPERTATPVCDSLDDRLEESAWSNPTSVNLNLRAARAAYGAYAIAEGLEFASRMLELDPDGAHASEMHTIVGVCARNLWIPAVRKEMTELCRRHFEAALSLEKEPQRRASLFCRVAVQQSPSNQQAARDCAVHAMAHAREHVDPELSPFYEAWALNARALAYYRASEFDEAAADCELAVEILRANLGRIALPPEEVPLTIWLLYDNLTRISLRAGWRERAIRYQKLAEEWASQLEPLHRPRWSAFAAQTVGDDLADAARRFEERLREARERLSPYDEALWQHTLGQVYYRQGAAEKALGAFRGALEIWRRTDGEYEDVTTEVLNSALAALRAGRGRDADAFLMELSGRQGMDSAEVAVEILAARGLATVLAGNANLGCARLDEAQAKSCELGDGALSARVLGYRARAANAAGESGRSEWERVRDAVRSSGGPDALGTGLAAIAEIAVLDANSSAQEVRNAVRLAAAALAEDDLEVWWAVQDLAEAMAAHTAPQEEDRAQEWSRLLAAAKARISRPAKREFLETIAQVKVGA